MYTCRAIVEGLDDFLASQFAGLNRPTQPAPTRASAGVAIIYSAATSLAASMWSPPLGENRWPAVASSRCRCIGGALLEDAADLAPLPAPRPRLTLAARPAPAPTFSLRGSRRQRYRRPSRRRSRS